MKNYKLISEELKEIVETITNNELDEKHSNLIQILEKYQHLTEELIYDFSQAQLIPSNEEEGVNNGKNNSTSSGYEQQIKKLKKQLSEQKLEFLCLEEKVKVSNEVLDNSNRLIRESEAKYKLLSELPVEGIVLHKFGQIKEVNKAFCDIFGYEKAELIDKELMTNLFTPESAELLRKYLAEEYTEPYFVEGVKKDGTILSLEVQGQNLTINGENCRLARVWDISGKISRERELQKQNSELKALEEELRASNEELISSKEQLIQSNERFRLFSELVDDGVVLHEDGIIVDVNPAFENMFGYKHEELVGSSLVEKIIETEFVELVKNNISTKYPDSYQVKGIRKDKSEVWIEFQGKNSDQYLGNKRVKVVRDVTALKQKELSLHEKNEKYATLNEELRESNEELHSLRKELQLRNEELVNRNINLEQKNDEIKVAEKELRASFVHLTEMKQKLEASELKYRTIADYTFDWEQWRKPDGTFEYVSPSCERITGYSFNEFLENKQLFENIVIDEDKQLWLNHAKTKLGEEGCEELIFRIKTKFGEIKWISHSCKEVIINGENLGRRSTNHDITTLVKNQEQLNFILNGTNAGTFDWHIQSDDLFINERWAGIIGYTKNELEPISVEKWANGVHPDDLKIAKEKVNKVLNKELDYYDTTFRQKHKDGHWVWVNARGSVVEWDINGKPLRMSGTHLDVTKQKEYEKQLSDKNNEFENLNKELQKINEELKHSKISIETSEKEFRMLFDNMEQGFALHRMIFDDNNKPVDYEYINANKAFGVLTGLNPAELKGKTVKELLPDTEKVWIDNFGAVARTGKAMHFENYAQELKKYYDVIAYCPKPGYFAVIFTDVTKIKEHEKNILLAKNLAEKNEQRLNSIIENTQAGYFFINNKGLFERVNKAWLELYKYNSYDEVIGKHFTEVQKIEDIEASRAFVEGIRNNNPSFTSGEFSRKCNDDSIGYHTFTAGPVFDQGEIIGIEGFLIDITEKKHFEEQLIIAKEIAIENEKKFSAIINNSKDAIGLTQNDIILEMNDAYAELFGYKKEELRGKSFEIHLAGTEKEKVRTLAQKRYAGEDVVTRYESVGLRKDGSVFPFEIQVGTYVLNNELYVISIIRDITKQKQREKELRETKERYDMATKIGLVGIWDINFHTGNVHWNDVTYQLLEFDPEDITPNFDLYLQKVYDEDKSKVDVAITKAWSEKEPFKLDHRIVVKNNEIRFCHVSGNVEYNEQDEPVRMLGTVQDITERKQFEQELLFAKQKAVESDRLKTEFLNNMSHEIRTPMNAIIGFSALLKKNDITENKRNDFINIVQSNSLRLLKIISDILELSFLETKQSQLVLKDVNLNDILLKYYNEYTSKANSKNIKLSLEIKDVNIPFFIHTDEVRLGSAINNIIENGLKFTPEGFVKVGYSTTKENLIIYVQDSGIGIEAKNFEKVFKRFAQENGTIARNYGGLGLGLTLASANIKLIGGSISLESTKNKGTTVYINLPHHAENKPTITREIQTPKVNHKKKQKILIAEDEEINYSYLEAILLEENPEKFEILYAKNGKEAVELFNANSDIDLVLMDIKMPVMDGFEATLRIKKIKPGIHVIAQTAYASREDEIMILNKGLDGFLSKPIEKEELFELLNKLNSGK